MQKQELEAKLKQEEEIREESLSLKLQRKVRSLKKEVS